MGSKAMLVIDMQRGLVLGAYRQNELVQTVNEIIGRVERRALRWCACSTTMRPLSP